MDKCLRCGKCCQINGKPCKYLGDGFCTIYETRLGADLGEGYVCGMREEKKEDIEGCPYNEGSDEVS